MAFRHYPALTLTGVAQNIRTALQLDDDSDPKARAVIFHPDSSNSNPIYVGGIGVGTTDWAFRLPAFSATLPPFILGEFDQGPLQLKDFWVIGTSGEKLHIGIVPW